MTGFDTCNSLRRGVFPYITPTLIGMPRIELGSHAYKAWALTNKQQNPHKSNITCGWMIFEILPECHLHFFLCHSTVFSCFRKIHVAIVKCLICFINIFWSSFDLVLIILVSCHFVKSPAYEICSSGRFRSTTARTSRNCCGVLQII